MSLPVLTRVGGVIRRPRPTFEAIAAEPRWGGVLVLTTAAAILAGTALMSTDVGQQALVDQWERTAVAFGRTVDDVEYSRMQRLSAYGPVYAIGTALLNGPILVVAASAGIWTTFGRTPVSATFRQVLAVVAHAGVILAVRQVLAAPIGYARETTASALTLGRWFPLLDEASPAARVLGMLDLFVLWWAVVLGIGVAVLYRRRARRVVLLLFGVYLVFAVTVAMVMAVTGGAA